MALKNIVSIVMQGVDKFSEPSKKVKRELSGLEKATEFLKDKLIGPGGLAAATAAVGAGMVALAVTANNRADDIGKFADRINVSTEFLSEMETVASRANVPVGQLQTGLQRLSRRAAEFATTGGGEAAATFERLDISVRNADGTIRSAESLLPELADRFAQLTDESEATALAFKLFDTEGVSFLQFLKDGSAGMAEAREEARKFGLSISRDAADKAADFNDSMGRLKDSARGLRDRLGLELTPAVQLLAENLERANTAALNLNENMSPDLAGYLSTVTGAELLAEREAIAAIGEPVPRGAPEDQTAEQRIRRVAELRQLIASTEQDILQVTGQDAIEGVNAIREYREELERLLELQRELVARDIDPTGPTFGRGPGLRRVPKDPELAALETIDPFSPDVIDGATQFEEKLGTISGLYVDLTDADQRFKKQTNDATQQLSEGARVAERSIWSLINALRTGEDVAGAFFGTLLNATLSFGVNSAVDAVFNRQGPPGQDRQIANRRLLRELERSRRIGGV